MSLNIDNSLIVPLLKQSGKGSIIVKDISDKMDAFILNRLPPNIQSQQIAVFATGGYGRGELAPYSDVDLMFFSRDRSQTSCAEDIYYALLDCGINISHSFRTPKECIEEADLDFKTKTSLLDSRFIAGNMEVKAVFDQMVAKRLICQDEANLRSFFTSLEKENNCRHARKETSYLLEPNIKEGIGCLREIHELLWFIKVVYPEHNIKSVNGLRIILKTGDLDCLLQSYDFLLRLRIAIHIISGRGNNILYRSMRNDASKMLGIRGTKKFTAGERLLRFFFLRTKTSLEICERIKNIAQCKAPKERYLYCGGLSHYSFANKRAEKGSKPSKNEILKTFLEIFKGDNVYETLFFLHQNGTIDKIIPEFGALRFLVVDDPYHHYTVDAHTLLSIKELETLSKEASPLLLHQLFNSCNEKHILYLSLLFHDIGKSGGRLHATVGYKTLKYILDRLKIDVTQREIIEFLVINHLKMADIAMNRDIEDRDVITSLAEICQTETILSGSETLLNYLLLVTYSDMKAVNPEFLSDWKISLLLNLYGKVLNYIRGIRSNREEYINNIINSWDAGRDHSVCPIGKPQPLSSSISDSGLLFMDAALLPEFLRNISTNYLISSTIETIRSDISLLYKFQNGQFDINIEHKKGDITEITIPAFDRPGLLADIVGIFSLRNLSIISLRTYNIHINNDRYIIDRIQISNWHEITWDKMAKEIKEQLSAVILQGYSYKLDNLQGLTPAMSLSRIIEPFIEVDNESKKHTIFEIICSDYIGLLHRIAAIFSVNKMDINTARINTESEVVHDVFYVTKDFKPLSFTDILETIREIWKLII